MLMPVGRIFGSTWLSAKSECLHFFSRESLTPRSPNMKNLNVLAL